MLNHYHCHQGPSLWQINELLERKLHPIMAALQDLQGAVAKLDASTSAELKAIADKLASFGDTVQASDVEVAVTAINAVAAKLDAETAALTPSPAPGV